MDKKRVCLDFDGVIHAYHKVPWTGPASIQGAPIPGAKEGMQKLRELGYKLYINSARFGHDRQSMASAKEWLEKWQLPYDEICEHKPYADFYIDDRGLTFAGDWIKTVDEIQNFQSWVKDYSTSSS